ncbi:MAG: 8-amino-7-oxononanoate synthase [Verrucomicrobiales bacterium]|nr:8-amino-7-oxononanoate synthase [Verrucomicrobiales bacterium]HCU87564.1 8-amino-7-oxononanoate synthase [Verrucomicrobiales bacterium]
MAGEFQNELKEELSGLDTAGLRRTLRIVSGPQQTRIQLDGSDVLHFSSNDYLGLANHPSLKTAAISAIEQHGAGAGAARLISGSQSPSHKLEAALAVFKNAEAALAFSSGYTAAIGVLPALAGAGDMIVIDKLVHASLVDAAKLSGAKLRVFRHNDLTHLDEILKQSTGEFRRVWIVAESVYSMDGDLAPLLNLVDLKGAHGANLLLDEAHATGLYGKGRRGLAEEFGVADRVELQMGTLGKALGAAGGFVCGSADLIELLRHRARSFMFSTAPVPAQTAAALAGLEIVQSEEGEERRARLWQRVDEMKNGLIARGWKLPAVRSAMVPLMVGGERETVALSERLLEANVFVPAIRYPTVAKGAARLRLTLSADHTPADIEELLEALGDA